MGKIKYIILVFLITISILNFYSQTVKSEEILRIHIIANSNSPKDQFVKYQVRDVLLNKYSKELSGLSGKAEIEKFIDKNFEDMLVVAEETLAENGFDYKAKGEKGKFDFPTRMYLDTIYPGGKYEAVRIVLGDGAGDNWWCVMFPPLCFVGEPTEEVAVPEELDSHGEANVVEYDFIILKWAKAIGSFIKGLF